MPFALLDTAAPAANCTFARGCGDAAPGAAAPADVAELARNHPCYSEDAHHHFARMHVAVAPACNVQCHYCHRKYDCANESRPGVVSERLGPEEAVRKVLAVAAEVPELSVVGIAGPGDALANPAATYATLEGIRRAAPDLTLCLSTNGLALPDHVERLAALGVRHVTVTVNAVDPGVGERIYPWIVRGGRKVRGREAARILSERQLEGIAGLAAKGVLVKVNSVVIPGVNDRHLPEVARAVRGAGAFLVNLVPLISAPEHGTHYGRSGQRGPTAEAARHALLAGANQADHIPRDDAGVERATHPSPRVVATSARRAQGGTPTSNGSGPDSERVGARARESPPESRRARRRACSPPARAHPSNTRAPPCLTKPGVPGDPPRSRSSRIGNTAAYRLAGARARSGRGGPSNQCYHVYRGRHARRSPPSIKSRPSIDAASSSTLGSSAPRRRFASTRRWGKNNSRRSRASRYQRNCFRCQHCKGQ